MRAKKTKDVGDFPALNRTPRALRPELAVTQMHYARRGIITPEMEFIAIRENLGSECPTNFSLSNSRDSLLHQHRGQSFGAAIPDYVTPEFVVKSRTWTRPSFPRTSITPNPNR